MTRKPITPDIGYELANPTGVSISPDGNLTVYGVSKPDIKSEKLTNSLWIKDIKDSDSAPRELTSGNTDGNPKFSPDGSSIAFLRDDLKGEKQICR